MRECDNSKIHITTTSYCVISRTLYNGEFISTSKCVLSNVINTAKYKFLF